jgi:hypothetical protein
MAKIHYEADGPISADRFISALTDFGDRRPELWPNLDTKFFELHQRGDTWAEVTEGTDFLGGVWGRERYDWSEPGIVRLRLLESRDFKPGTQILYRVTPNADGGCHVAVDFQRIAASLRGRIVGVAVQLAGSRRFVADLRQTFEHLARLDAEGTHPA